MTTPKIPPRPWRVSDAAVAVLGSEVELADIFDRDNEPVFLHESSGDPPNRETAELIVRLVNAEPQIVAALEEAEASLALYSADTDSERALALVRAALAKVRGR